MSIAVSIRIGINLGAGNAEQPRVSARVTMGCGSKYLHCEKNTSEKYQFYFTGYIIGFR